MPLTTPFRELHRPLRTEAEARADTARAKELNGEIWGGLNKTFSTHPIHGQRWTCKSCGHDWYDYGRAPDKCRDCGGSDIALFHAKKAAEPAP